MTVTVLVTLTALVLTACASDADPSRGRERIEPERSDSSRADETLLRLDEGSFEVPGGAEGFHCVRLPVPIEGDVPVFLRGVDWELPVGTHHFVMTYTPAPLEKREPCYDQAFVGIDKDPVVDPTVGKVVFASSEGKGRFMLPEPYVLHLSSAAGQFVTNHHVLNFDDQPIEMSGTFGLHLADDETTLASSLPLSTLVCDQRDVKIAAHSSHRVTATCKVPFDLDLVLMWSHAHQHLDRFEVRLFDGEETRDEVIYESTDWDTPRFVVLDQPIRLRAGEGLTFSCEYTNDGDAEVAYGHGRGELGEMCTSMNSYAFPPERRGEVPPPLAGATAKNGAIAVLYDTTRAPMAF